MNISDDRLKELAQDILNKTVSGEEMLRNNVVKRLNQIYRNRGNYGKSKVVLMHNTLFTIGDISNVDRNPNISNGSVGMNHRSDTVYITELSAGKPPINRVSTLQAELGNPILDQDSKRRIVKDIQQIESKAIMQDAINKAKKQ